MISHLSNRKIRATRLIIMPMIMRAQSAQSKEQRAQRANCTEHWAQSTEHRAKSTGHRAQSTEHWAQSTEKGHGIKLRSSWYLYNSSTWYLSSVHLIGSWISLPSMDMIGQLFY